MKWKKRKLLAGNVKTSSLLITIAIIVVGGTLLKLLADSRSRVDF